MPGDFLGPTALTLASSVGDPPQLGLKDDVQIVSQSLVGAELALPLTAFLQKDQAFQLVSAASPEDDPQCLVVAGGRVRNEGSEFLLESCKDVKKKGDGRGAYLLQPNGQLVTAVGRRCLARSPDDTDAGQGLLQLADCDEASKRELSWKLLEQGQLFGQTSGYILQGRRRKPKVAAGGAAAVGAEIPGAQPSADGFCLSMAGELPLGKQDLALHKEVDATSISDPVAHHAGRAVDGNPATFWASQKKPPTPVTFDVDLDGNHPLSSIDIEWECPPSNYSVQIKHPTKGWVEQFNTMNDEKPVAAKQKQKKLRVPLEGQRASAVRIGLHAPVPKCYGVDAFAINSLQVQAPRVRPVLEQCSEVVKFKDARGRWFLSDIRQFDPAKRQEAIAQKLAVASQPPSPAVAAPAGATAPAGPLDNLPSLHALALASAILGSVAMVQAKMKQLHKEIDEEKEANPRTPKPGGSDASTFGGQGGGNTAEPERRESVAGSRNRLMFPQLGV
eukprot:TRINITY_DN72822_c0_g1_i1.p1 TRINITY_DN72822_c0_g1~~TRINITY_DN72822_c0_g1_i1.p1  ORF type:complete len:517 (-),score=102.28 TRINITY_DN72822_c0_g1_i1:191-1699(-)